MAKTLRALRAEQLLSTRRLAMLSGASNKTIVQIENGRQTPTFATIEKISRVLRVEPGEVAEFALALAERGRAPVAGERILDASGQSAAQLLCISPVAAFLTVARRLLEAGSYGVTTMIGVVVTAEQVACLRPAVVVLDLGSEAPPTLSLLQCLRGNPATTQLPIVVTGRDRRRLEEVVAGLDAAARQGIIVAPFDRDLGELVAAVTSMAGGVDGEPAG